MYYDRACQPEHSYMSGASWGMSKSRSEGFYSWEFQLQISMFTYDVLSIACIIKTYVKWFYWLFLVGLENREIIIYKEIRVTEAVGIFFVLFPIITYTILTKSN